MVTESSFLNKKEVSYQAAINELRTQISNLEKYIIIKVRDFDSVITDLNNKISVLEKAKTALESDIVDLELKIESLNENKEN